jgi:hypothetical protein
MFQKATKKKSKLRILLEGFSGSGKTYSALTLAKGMGGKVAVIDTEKGSASLYSNNFEFDVCELSPPYSPESYVKAIKAAEDAGYEIIIIDSITHEWSGDGGVLDIHSNISGQNSYANWSKVTPRHNAFIEAILQSSCHVICTARSKKEYESGVDNGKKYVRKVGTKTEQRDGLDFEFTTVFKLNQFNFYEVEKDRTGLFKGIQSKITDDTAKQIMDWLDDGIDEVLMYSDRLKACKNMDELKECWAYIPKHIKESVDYVKSEMKDCFMATKQ